MSDNSEHSPRVQARVPHEIKKGIEEALKLVNADGGYYQVRASDLIVHGLWLVLTGLGIDVEVSGWKYSINSELKARVPIYKDWVDYLKKGTGIDDDDARIYSSSKMATDVEKLVERLSDMETGK